MGIFTNIFKKKTSNLADYQIESIKRQITIMSESVNLVNDSNNLETVIHRYDMLCNTLQKLTSYTNAELQEAGYQLKEPLTDTLETVQKNRINIFNQAIERNITHELEMLHEKREKLNKLEILYRKFGCMPGLSGDNIQFLKNIYFDIKNNLSEELTGYDKSTVIIDEDKNITYYMFHPKEISDFYALSNLIEHEKNIDKRIEACEKSYLLLPQFVHYCLEELHDSELPPFINCRDVGPELYMRLGKWNEARNAIAKCIAANAYYPDFGEIQLENLEDYKRVAEKIILFLKENPGFQQKDIYKALNFSEDEKEYAKHFCRCSLQIKKEPFNKTNRLYVLNNE